MSDSHRNLGELPGRPPPLPPVLVQGEEEGVEELFRRGLDWLGRVVRYDLAAVFLLEGSRLVLRSARGPLADARVRGHALELARFPSVRETLESRRARAFTEADHAHGEGDPFDAVLGLPPGHSCMVVPLCAGERAYGVLTLDRTQCEQYPEGVVGLAEVFGQLLALALQGAEQRASLRRMHRQDHAHAKLLEEALVGGSSGPFLEASRAPRVRELALRARQVAEADAPVLLLGEAGAGKARVARAIHLWSRRAEQPFVSLRLAALPAAGLEAALFGGGAVGGPPGRLELAHGGTLFLDGVEALGPALQERLAHALGQGDVRVVAASSGRLQEAVGTRFREDLYFRLSAFTLQVPALRERLEDLPALCEALLAEGAARTGRSGLRVTPAGLQRLAAHPWPGNLRELANVLERAALLARGEALGPELLELPGGAPGAAGAAGVAGAGAGGEHAPPEAGTRPGAVTLEEVQRRHIEAVLARCGGRVYGPGGAAQQLGLKPSTLQSRMKKLGVVARPAQQG